MGNRRTIRRTRRVLVTALLGGLAFALLPGSVPANAVTPVDPLCQNQPVPSAPQTKVLVLGDSITSGVAGDYTWRYFTYEHLLASGVNADMVGPSTWAIDDVGLGLPSDEFVCPFPSNHDAIPGGLLKDYLLPSAVDSTQSRIHYDVSHYGADVVILYAGLNDLYQDPDDSGPLLPDTPDDVLAHAKQAVQQAQAANPDVKIVLTTGATYPDGPLYPPVQAFEDKVKEYNADLEAQAPGWTVGDSAVSVAQTGKNWGQPDLTYDYQHPNVQGELDLAAAIDTALHTDGVGDPAPAVPDVTAYLGPRLPATLAVPQISGTDVNLSWVLSPGASKTAIEREDLTSSSPTWTTVAEREVLDAPACLDSSSPARPTTDRDFSNPLVAPYTCTWTDSTTVVGHTYVYRLREAKTNLYATNVTSNEETVAGVGPVPPPPPLGNVGVSGAVAGVHAVTVTWNPVATATGYHVEWRRSGVAAWSGAQVSGQAIASYRVASLPASVAYQFRVTAERGSDSSTPSSPVTRAANGAVLAAPGKPVLKALTRHRIRASWAARAGATRYQVQIFKSGHWVVAGYTVKPSFTTGKLKKGTKYSVRVRAYDGTTAGNYSATSKVKAT